MADYNPWKCTYCGTTNDTIACSKCGAGMLDQQGSTKKGPEPPGEVEIGFLLDESGSMLSMMTEARTGFNQFLDDQQKQGDNARLTLALFNTRFNLKYDGWLIADAKPLAVGEYHPDNMTALNDSLARLIAHINTRVEKATDGVKVIIVVLSDGYENASHEYKNIADIQRLVKSRQKAGWDIIYLAAGIDAARQGRDLGIAMPQAISMSGGYRGMSATFATASAYVSQSRAGTPYGSVADAAAAAGVSDEVVDND